MGLQAAAIASQIDLNNSQAEKNRADAKKTSGVDTEMQNANIDYVIAQTSNEKIKKYEPNKKNGGNVPPLNDERTLYVPVGCQNCIECDKQKRTSPAKTRS